MPRNENPLLWSQLYDNACYPHYLQSPHWHTPDKQIRILTLAADGTAIAGSTLNRLPVLGGLWAYYEAVRGPLFTSTNALRTHLQELKQHLPKDCIGLHVSPYIYRSDKNYQMVQHTLANLDYTPVSPARNSLYTATPLVDLSTGIDTIRQGYRNAYSRQLKKSAKAGVKVITSKSQTDMDEYVRGHTQANLARGAPPPNDAIRQGWYRLLQQTPEQLRLSLAQIDGQTIAGQISVICGDRLIYEWGFSNPSEKYKTVAKSHLLHDAAIEYGVHIGLSTYDIGGFWKQRGTSDSLNRFKLSITQQIDDVLPKHEYLIKPFAHKVYFALRGILKKSRQ